MLKKLVIVLLGVILMLPFSSLGEDYQNPMTIPGQYPPIRGASYDYGIGDPFVMRFNGLYYLYASSCEDRVRVYTSRARMSILPTRRRWFTGGGIFI